MRAFIDELPAFRQSVRQQNVLSWLFTGLAGTHWVHSDLLLVLTCALSKGKVILHSMRLLLLLACNGFP